MADKLTALAVALTLASAGALVSRRLGMGAILGLLLAGIMAGPHVLELAGDPDDLRHLAELGVALLLFVIGLELHPRKLWGMRGTVFGLGTAQVVITGVVLGIGAYAFSRDWRLAVLVGAGLALSSTAMILQMLRERGELDKEHGQTVFGILLLQDIAIVPMVALVPLLALAPSSWDWTVLPGRLAIMGSVISGIAATGYWGLPWLLRVARRGGGPEAFYGLLLATVLGAALASEWAGLSMALGGFLLGLSLSDGDGCLDVAEAIQPFKALLLAFFFVVVGMSVALPEIPSLGWYLVGGVFLVMTVKGGILYGLVRWTGRSPDTARRTAFYLPQCGEFGFVLYSAAAGVGLLDARTHTALILLISLTMLLTPFLVRWEQGPAQDGRN